MKMLVIIGSMFVLVGSASLLWGFWAVSRVASSGVSAVAGGFGPIALLLPVGLLFLLTALIWRLVRRY
jgi:hypothetical protein